MQTVGEILRAERVKKSLSIKDVESAISIRALYLNAIEEGNYSIIPGEVYLKGFIRNYATFLGLNPQEIMEIYRQNKGQVSEIVPTVSQSEAVEVSPAPNGGLTKWLVTAIVAAGVVAGVTWWSSGGSQKPASPPLGTQQSGSAAQQQPLQTNPPTQSAAPIKSTEKVIVTAKYNAQCWTQIMADGKEIYSGIPKSGDSLTWEAVNKLTAKFGNANAVELVYNGSPVGKIGGNGEVVVKTFTINGITQ